MAKRSQDELKKLIDSSDEAINENLAKKDLSRFFNSIDKEAVESYIRSTNIDLRSFLDNPSYDQLLSFVNQCWVQFQSDFLDQNGDIPEEFRVKLRARPEFQEMFDANPKQVTALLFSSYMINVATSMDYLEKKSVVDSYLSLTADSGSNTSIRRELVRQHNMMLTNYVTAITQMFNFNDMDKTALSEADMDIMNAFNSEHFKAKFNVYEKPTRELFSLDNIKEVAFPMERLTEEQEDVLRECYATIFEGQPPTDRIQPQAPMGRRGWLKSYSSVDKALGHITHYYEQGQLEPGKYHYAEHMMRMLFGMLKHMRLEKPATPAEVQIKLKEALLDENHLRPWGVRSKMAKLFDGIKKSNSLGGDTASELNKIIKGKMAEQKEPMDAEVLPQQDVHDARM